MDRRTLLQSFMGLPIVRRLAFFDDGLGPVESPPEVPSPTPLERELLFGSNSSFMTSAPIMSMYGSAPLLVTSCIRTGYFINEDRVWPRDPEMAELDRRIAEQNRQLGIDDEDDDEDE